MRPTIQLPSGIPVSRFRDPFTVQWAQGSAVIVGENLVPSVVYLTADVPPQSERPALTVKYEVVGGVVRCTDFAFWTERPEQSVRIRDLEWVMRSWDKLRTEALSACMLNPGPNSSWVMPGNRDLGAAKRLPKPPRSNRSLRDPLFVAKIAAVYNDNPVGGTEAVADSFEVSRSMAQRYVKAARDAGLIEDRRRNRPINEAGERRAIPKEADK